MCRFRRRDLDNNGNDTRRFTRRDVDQSPPTEKELFNGKLAPNVIKDLMYGLAEIPLLPREKRAYKYDPAMCETVIELMARGLFTVQVANRLGISTRTLYRWEKQFEDFAYALRCGRGLCEDFWLEIGKIGMWHPNFKAHVYSMIMGNKLKWNTSREEKEIKGKVGVEVGPAMDLKALSVEELHVLRKLVQRRDGKEVPELSHTPV